jgi:hypothetical protein
VRQRAARLAAENILAAQARFIHPRFSAALNLRTIKEHDGILTEFFDLNRISFVND